ncbi:hypothetical protein [Mycobacterium barrassiae]|uniref:hypothetical protein n=1 Tax=Mycobacterium barrassiae TaxID=319709 RepID=UPI002265924A|nr:hypothetical protein [Mycobacterium barrassiae]
MVDCVTEIDQWLGDHPEVQQVRVGVDEAGHHRGPVEVYDGGVRSGSAAHESLAAHGGDAPVSHGNRFGNRV